MKVDRPMRIDIQPTANGIEVTGPGRYAVERDRGQDCW
jgi:hypothetical protein